jgi:hypothetical protein
MRLKATDTQAKQYRIYFDGRPITQVVEASEEESWVDILDTKFIGMIAPITQTDNSIDMSEPEEQEIEFKTKRLYGKVELKLIPRK